MLGSSLVVQPAAGFISNFTGDNLVIINRDATSYDRQADLVIHNDMTEVVEEVFKNKYKVQRGWDKIKCLSLFYHFVSS